MRCCFECRRKRILKLTERFGLVLGCRLCTGFALLPVLWFVNFVYYRLELSSDAAPQPMKSHVRWSGYFCALCAMAWISWLIVYYVALNRGEDWPRSFLIFDSQKLSW